MPLSDDKAIELAKTAKDFHDSEREPLDLIRRYWKGTQGILAVVPSSAPKEVRTMARLARVNICSIVVGTMAQSVFVDGYRGKEDETDAKAWSIWQANKLDSRQSGIHRAAFAYGTSYSVVLPGDRGPVIKGVSPRNLTAVYGEDPDWPLWALEKLDRNGLWRLLDEESAFYLKQAKGSSNKDFELIERRDHNASVTPVVRYLDEDDLDADDDVESDEQTRGAAGIDCPMRGQVAPLMAIQDQIDLTTFGLLVAQWYSAFRQRYAIGWVAADEKALMDRLVAGDTGDEDPEELVKKANAAREAARIKAGASQLWTFDEHPENMKLGEFEQTNLDGYIKSREASLRHAASLSQTPVHELIGDLVNLSAEALAAAEAGRDRKIDERQTLLGESHEQTLWLAARLGGLEAAQDAQVVWRDTSARAFAATVDALGKLVQMLGIPPQELWERVPGATRQDIERWKAAAREGDSFKVLADLIERQGKDGPATEPPVSG